MSNASSLPNLAQPACRDLNAAVTGPSWFPGSGTASCAIASSVPIAQVLLTHCCNATQDGRSLRPNVTNATTPSIYPQLASIGDHSNNGCDWKYCNVSGQEGINAFSTCMNITARAGVQSQCFLAANQTLTDVKNGGRISWRNRKTKQESVSAALLIALGVAGIILGT